MTDPQQALQALLRGGGGGDLRFPPTSRYYQIGTETRQTPDGRRMVYLKRRLVPPPEDFQTLQEHRVVQGDRLDLLASKYLGDPEAFWRLCDANGALIPAELEVEDRDIRITLPQGVPIGGGNA